MHVTCRFVYLFIFTFLTFKCSIEVNGDGNDSGEDTNETSSEEVYQFEAEDDIEEVNAEDDQPQDDKGGLSFANTIEEKGEDSPPPQTIEINILPVSSDEFSCKGVPNGNQVDPNPTNCLSFYTCVDEVAYKIMCPQIPFKTYYNPVQKTCGDVDETFCLTFAGDSEKISSEKSDLTPDEEQDTIDQTNFGGEIFDELIHDRVEL